MDVYGVSSDVPFLLGLGFLDKHQLYGNDVSNYPCSPQPDIEIPLTHKYGHIYLEW